VLEKLHERALVVQKLLRRSPALEDLTAQQRARVEIVKQIVGAYCEGTSVVVHDVSHVHEVAKLKPYMEPHFWFCKRSKTLHILSTCIISELGPDHCCRPAAKLSHAHWSRRADDDLGGECLCLIPLMLKKIAEGNGWWSKDVPMFLLHSHIKAPNAQGAAAAASSVSGPTALATLAAAASAPPAAAAASAAAAAKAGTNDETQRSCKRARHELSNTGCVSFSDEMRVLMLQNQDTMMKCMNAAQETCAIMQTRIISLETDANAAKNHAAALEERALKAEAARDEALADAKGNADKVAGLRQDLITLAHAHT
jgi:hypothetical protein